MSDPLANETIPVDTTGGEATAGLSANVNIYMPFNIVVDELTAELFGKAVDLSGTEIIVGDEIPVNLLYEDDEENNTGVGWLHFLQALDEDTFEVYVNRAKVADVSGGFAAALYLEEGETYDPTNNGATHLDASGVFGEDVGATWYNYNSLQDFLMGYFAKKILGHPGALAAISNDSSLRAAYTEKYKAGMRALEGEAASAMSDVPESLDASGVAAVLVADEPDNGLTQADLNIIVQQMMNQAPERFHTARGDRGTLQPVVWVPGDKIYIQLKLADNKYQLNQTAPTSDSHGVLLGVNNSSVIGTLTSISDDYYVLVFTIGDVA
jgi:hypothetical protein